MTESVAFDITRLFIGPMSANPRGIDRVDIGYARHFLENWSGECVGVLPTPWGIRWFSRDRSLLVVNFIEEYWSESAEPEANHAYQWVKARLQGDRRSLPPTKADAGAIPARLASGFVRFARRYGLVFGQPMKSLPRRAVYLNTGQTTLAVPLLLRWLGTRKDVTPIFMLHDAIPIEHPEYCTPRSSRLHQQMLANTLRYAAGLILTTEAAGTSIRNALLGVSHSNLPMLVAPLPVPTAFLRPTEPDPELCDTSYFVVTGAIEPRKNHLLLLNVWRQLIRDHGPATPKLVLAGSRTRPSDAVINMLDQCQLLREHVIEIAGLPTPALRQLLAGARALLMPSFAEGFGLPIIEALALGTPVIASDLPSHREAAGGCASYVGAADQPGWLAAIRRHCSGGAAQAEARRLARSYRPQTWADYFRRVEPFMGSASHAKSSMTGGEPERG